MHPCLSVDEIVRLIACELVASERRATTVALACCCKIFEDPALDALWETQDELLPLLQSLPGDVWDGEENVGVPTTYVLSLLNTLIRKSFTRSPTPPEWTRFRKYARRMRMLSEDGDLETLSSEVFWVLQICAANGPLFPNLRNVNILLAAEGFVPFIPLFLSPGIATISIEFDESDIFKVMVPSIVATFPTLCPNLRNIYLKSLPRNPTITAAISGMLLASNINVLRTLHVDSPLTEEAREAIHNLPDLRDLSVVVERDTSLPPLVLPNLTNLLIECDRVDDWLGLFRGATFGKLDAVTFRSGFEQNENFFEAFEKVALAASIQNTLSKFHLYGSWPWNPNYSSLLPFTQMTYLVVRIPCTDDCSSTVDDDVVTSLARTMPKLETLRLGNSPCGEIHAGVTVTGLVVLAHHCPNLSALCIHFQVDSLSVPPTTVGVASSAGTATLRRDCALRDLDVGGIFIAEESILVVAMTLARIFPRIEYIFSGYRNWEKVMDAIRLSRQIVDCSSKEHYLSKIRSNFCDTSSGATLEGSS